MFTIKVLKSMPYAQAHIRVLDDGAVHLFSYETLVAEIDSDGWLRIYGLFSQTTRKHISAFMREYTPCDYYTAKHIYQSDMVLNIHTGEVLEYENYYQEDGWL